MTQIQEIQDTAQAGADSVFEYIERTAETVSDGIRWRTLSYYNEPQYDISVFNGVAGISLFLANYYLLTGIPKAQVLALGANRWCMAPERTVDDESLCFGRSGIGRACLRLSEVTDDADQLKGACEIADRLLELQPGPVTDFLGGAAGEGIFLIRLWETSREKQYLSGAVRHGEWLESKVVRSEFGCHWPMRVGDIFTDNYLGFAHGIAGIGFFPLQLYEATGDSHWADLTRVVAETLSKHAQPDRGGLNWPPIMGMSELNRCQWCNGAPGVGLFYAKAYEVLGEPSYLETAEAAGETTFAYGDVRSNPSQCHGLAGNAELLIELYRITRDALWLERAHDFATRVFAYRKTTPEGDVWPADEPGYDSPDFMCGAAGTGHFFLRLLAPDRLRMPLL